MRLHPSLALFLLFGCASAGPDVVTNSCESRSTGETPAVDVRGLSTTYSAAYGTREFTIHATLDASRTAMHIEGFEFIDSSSGDREIYEWDMTEPTDGVVVECMVMRDTNDWYLACRSSTGLVDVERWVLGRTDGAYYCERPTFTRGVGEALTTPELEVRIENQRYLPPPQRLRPPFTKTVLLRGLALDPVVTMMVDPDARYLVLQTTSARGSSRLIELALTASASRPLAAGDTIPLADSATVPALASNVSMGLLEHPQHGRAITFSDLRQHILLWDQENDGVFESRQEMDWRDYCIAYPYECWSRSF